MDFITGTTAALPIDPKYGDFEYFAVGEGQTQYFAYVFQQMDEDGHRLLMTRGLDLLADTPEGKYLLDAMIGYVQSEASEPDALSELDGQSLVKKKGSSGLRDLIDVTLPSLFEGVAHSSIRL